MFYHLCCIKTISSNHPSLHFYFGLPSSLIHFYLLSLPFGLILNLLFCLYVGAMSLDFYRHYLKFTSFYIDFYRYSLKFTSVFYSIYYLDICYFSCLACIYFFPHATSNFLVLLFIYLFCFYILPFIFKSKSSLWIWYFTHIYENCFVLFCF